MIGEDFDWSQKYRPRKVDDVILPDSIKQSFKADISKGNIQNCLLVGGSGVGKTTLAMAALDELGVDYIKINASLYGNIDTLRTEIQNFASTVSFTGGRKYVILDEADYLNANSTQPALRNFMEEFSTNCGFILTCNYPKRIIKELHSRVTVIHFKIPKAELPKLATQMMKRICFILDTEGVPYEKEAVAAVIKKHLPDWRRSINEIQKYSKTGKIDAGILVNTDEENTKELIGFMKARKWDDMRKWIGTNSDIEPTDLMRSVYDGLSKYVTKESMPPVILLLSKYQYQAAFAADAEINMVACMTEIMMEAEFL